MENKNVLNFEDRGFWLKAAEKKKPEEFDWRGGVDEILDFIKQNTDIKADEKEKDGVPGEMMSLMSSIFIMISTLKQMNGRIIELEKSLAEK